MEKIIVFIVMVVTIYLLLTWSNQYERKLTKKFKEKWATKPLFRVSKTTNFILNKTSYVLERKRIYLGECEYVGVETFDNEKKAIDACDRLNKRGKYYYVETEIIH